VNPQRLGLNPQQIRRTALWLVAVAVSGALGGLWWTGNRRAEINYLPGWGSAQWIVYPTAPDMRIHPHLELPSIFKTSFDLKQVPSKAVLKIAAFHRYELVINGTLLGKPLRAGKNWKQPDLFELSSQLQPGENRIEIRVSNSNGPPALWLYLDADTLKVSSGEDWQASHAGAIWHTAVLASKPKVVTVGCEISGGDQPWPSLRARWPFLLVCALLSAAGCWLIGGSARNQQAPARWKFWRKDIFPVLLLAGFGGALFANNVGALAPKVGYDADSHLASIRYIQENHSLPLASEGWEMFQAPLYYLLSAKLLSLFSLSTSDSGGILALRILGWCCGVTQIVVVWAALRLLFPRDGAKQRLGLVLAACLPPVLYLSQYVSNEGMAAALASVCLYLCLRMLKQGDMTWRGCAGLGLCLGAAVLTKATNVLLVPLILGSLLWRRLDKRGIPRSHCAWRMGLIFLSAVVVCGWHYARVWRHYGNPLIGNWDTRTGFVWWMDDGYRTGAYYLRWGTALLHPWFAGFRSFGGGIYSTLWGDSLLGGAPGFAAPHPPWNYDLMAIGYWLALLPTLAILVGAIVAFFKFIARPSAEWFLLLGFGFGVAVALVYMSLVVPCGGMVKAFYGLPALLPLCAIGALGLDLLAARHRYWRFICFLLFGVWAINSYASFWVLRGSQSYALTRAQTLIRENQLAEAGTFLNARLEAEPRATQLRLLFVYALPSADLDEIERQAQMVVQQEPDNYRGWMWQADVFARRGQIDKAMEATRRSVELAPGDEGAYQKLANLLMSQSRYQETIRLCREGLQKAAASPGLRMALGFALLVRGQDEEASAQFRYVSALAPELLVVMNNVAWTMATDEDPKSRNGVTAVKLAEQVCALTQYQKPPFLSTLAAAYAEAGRYVEAVKIAERARAAAFASGATDLSAKDQELIELFKSGKPYRQRNP
jgi:tetratricopeptide (TPR) repeat protein